MDEEIKEIIANKMSINKETLSKDSLFADDLGVDSLDRLEIIVAFEKKFSIEIPDEDAEKISTVGDAIDYIKSIKQPI